MRIGAALIRFAGAAWFSLLLICLFNRPGSLALSGKFNASSFEFANLANFASLLISYAESSAQALHRGNGAPPGQRLGGLKDRARDRARGGSPARVSPAASGHSQGDAPLEAARFLYETKLGS